MLKISPLKIIPATGEEHPAPGLGPEETVAALSRQKADEVAAKCAPEDVIIAADTIVWFDGEILGKPKDHDDAVRMLTALSGREHIVYTGVAVLRGGELRQAAEQAKGRFRALSAWEIEAYSATGEPMDKAGAYGAQGRAAVFVEGITGDFFNVMGLPLCRLGKMLAKLGVELI